MITTANTSLSSTSAIPALKGLPRTTGSDTFPSVAVGYVISEEPFFKNAVPWMNRLKLRYSDGYVGSDYAKSRWLYTSSYFKDNGGYIREDMMANTLAQWERAHKTRPWFRDELPQQPDHLCS